MKRDVGKYIKSGGRLIEKYERMGAGGEAVCNGVDSCEGIVTSSPSPCAGCERHPKRALVLTLWQHFLAGVVDQHRIGRLHSLGVVLSVVLQGQSGFTYNA